jgi:hypothetical protein
LDAAMHELAGEAHISFEGELRKTRLLSLPDSSQAETSSLRRNTIWPEQDFVVLRLEKDSLDPIVSAVGGTIPRSVLHIQIEKKGTLEFGMYDGSQHLFLGPALGTDFAMRLEHQGILARI